MRELYGDERAETTHSAMWMAVFLERKGDFEEAEHWARETSPFNERHPLHIETALHLRTLGGIRLVRGDRVEAEALLRRGLAIMRQLFPAGAHPDEGDILNRLAFIAVERGAKDADEIYAQAAAFERARKSGPFFVTDGYDYLARAAQRRGDRELAETLYRRAVRLYEAELPEGHPYRTAAESGLADLSASVPPLRAGAALKP
jgi:tetratricopeptide (TPR) repeat protein